MTILRKNAQIGGKWQMVSLSEEEAQKELEMLRTENMIETVKCLELADRIPNISDEFRFRIGMHLAERNCISSFSRLSSALDEKIEKLREEALCKRQDAVKKYERTAEKKLEEPAETGQGESEIEKAMKGI
jgi:hypothetical protein